MPYKQVQLVTEVATGVVDMLYIPHLVMVPFYALSQSLC